MVPKSASRWIWLLTIAFMVIGLALFPTVNNLLASYGYAVVEDDNSKFLGFISFFWINVIAFVLSITAQAAMILPFYLVNRTVKTYYLINLICLFFNFLCFTKIIP